MLMEGGKSATTRGASLSATNLRFPLASLITAKNGLRGSRLSFVITPQLPGMHGPVTTLARSTQRVPWAVDQPNFTARMPPVLMLRWLVLTAIAWPVGSSRIQPRFSPDVAACCLRMGPPPKGISHIMPVDLSLRNARSFHATEREESQLVVLARQHLSLQIFGREVCTSGSPMLLWPEQEKTSPWVTLVIDASSRELLVTPVPQPAGHLAVIVSEPPAGAGLRKAFHAAPVGHAAQGIVVAARWHDVGLDSVGPHAAPVLHHRHHRS